MQPVRFFDFVTLAAIFLGPVFAVWVSMRREESRRKAERRLGVFRDLMTTRQTMMSADHVRAINSIQVDFYGDTPVIEAWKAYVDHLGLTVDQSPGALERWFERGQDFFFVLLDRMSKAVGYEIDPTDIRRLSYRPRAHGDWEEMQTATARNWAEIVAGRRPLRVVTESAPPADTQTSPPRSA